jgi:hypothetical protein
VSQPPDGKRMAGQVKPSAEQTPDDHHTGGSRQF